MAPSMSPDGGKSSRKEQRQRSKRQNVECYKDVARWLTDIAKNETRIRKDRGELKGRQQFGVARLIDPWLRQWAWTQLWIIQNPGRPESECPPPPPPPEDPFEEEAAES